MPSYVRLRTIPFATNAAEVAAEAALSRLMEAASALRNELAEDSPDAAVIGQTREEIEKAIRALLRSSRVLERNSPYRRAPVEAALEEAESVTQMARALGGAITEAAALDAGISDLFQAVSRSAVADVLDEALTKDPKFTLRAVARRAQLAPAYLSELKNGKSGLPSKTVCQKLDQVLGTELGEKVGAARTRLSELKNRASEHRVKRGRGSYKVAQSLQGKSSQAQSIAAVIMSDDQLLEITGKLLNLPTGARRAVEKLIDELDELFPPRARRGIS